MTSIGPDALGTITVPWRRPIGMARGKSAEDLGWGRRGGDVPVGDRAAEAEVPQGAPDQDRLVPRPAEDGEQVLDRRREGRVGRGLRGSAGHGASVGAQRALALARERR